MTTTLKISEVQYQYCRVVGYENVHKLVMTMIGLRKFKIDSAYCSTSWSPMMSLGFGAWPNGSC